MMSSVRALRLVLALLLAAVIPQGASAGEIVRLNGTGCGVVLVKPLIAAFRKSNPGVRFEIERSLGSAASLKAIAAGALDIAIAGRALKPAEMHESLVWTEYGKIPYAVVTSRENKVPNVTSQELAGMLAGSNAKWPSGDYVRVILRPQEDIDTKVLRQISPEMDRAVTAAHARKDMLLGVTDQEAFEYLRKTSGSVGFVPLAMPLSEPGSTNISRFNGVEPTLNNLASGRYPYAKSLVVVTRKQGNPAAERFVRFMNSEKGRALARKAGLLYTGK